MPNIINITKLEDGPRNVIFHVFLQSDGVTGDIVNYVVADPADNIEPETAQKPDLAITELWYDLPSPVAIQLSFQYLAENTPVWTMSAGNSVHIDFTAMGGLYDWSQPLDGTGRLMFTTNGLLTEGQSCTFLLKLKKKREY